MKRLTQIFIMLCLAAPLLACAALSKISSTATPAPITQPAAGAPAYNPSSDPATDLQKAVDVAQKENKRILVEVGGEWCVWCHIMDRFYDSHPALLKLREDHYVLLKVNFSEENQNKAFLSQYPTVPGYPHIFILDSDGTLLHSQNTSELEDGQSYNEKNFTAFLIDWAKP